MIYDLFHLHFNTRFFKNATLKPVVIVFQTPIKILALCFLALQLLSGCANNEEITEDNFGYSVQHMITLQTSNPSKVAQGLDGQKAELIFRKYRSDVASPQEVDAKALGTQSAQQSGQN